MAAEGAITSVRMLGCSRGTSCDSGQFVLGQPENARNESLALRLPTAAELFPELVDPKLDRKDTLPSCSALEALARQEPS